MVSIHNALKIKPPLVFSIENADELVVRLKTVVSEGVFPSTRKVDIQVLKPREDFTEKQSVAASLITVLANPNAYKP